MKEEYFTQVSRHKFFPEARGIAQWVKALATNSNDWSSTPGTHMVERENHLLKVVLQHNYVGVVHINYDMCIYSHTWMYVQTHTKLKKKF